MNLKYKLLEHPFYQNWESGKITLDQLANYSKSYNEFISRIPDFWKRIIDSLNPGSKEGNKIIEEEKNHITLWQKWSEQLPSTDSNPSMNNVITAFENLNPSELLGAIHSFEIQQPEVAKTKKSGLIKHYGFSENDTIYFDEHMNEAEHIKYGEYLYKNFAGKKDFENGFSKGSELIFHSLDKFMN